MENVRKRIIRNTSDGSDGFDDFDDDIDSLNIDSIDLKGEDIANEIDLASQHKSAEKAAYSEKDAKAKAAPAAAAAAAANLEEEMAKVNEALAKLQQLRQPVPPFQNNFSSPLASAQKQTVQFSDRSPPTGSLTGLSPRQLLTEPPRGSPTGSPTGSVPYPLSNQPPPPLAPGNLATTRKDRKTNLESQILGSENSDIMRAALIGNSGGRNPFTLKRKKGYRKEKKRRFAKHKHSFNLNKQKKKSKSSVKINY